MITGGETPELWKIVKGIDDFQASLLKPRNFDSQNPENYIKQIESSFENVCTSLEELGIQSPDRLTVFRFYSKIAYFKKKKPPKK